MPSQSYSRGVAYVVLGGACLSFGGLLVRFVEDASPWTILFYRSLVFICTVVLFLLLRDGKQTMRQLFAVHRSDLFVSFLLAVGFISYVLSLFHTTVANTVLILTTGPILAGVLAYFVLGEVVGKITWVAMVIAVGGVAVMVAGGIQGGDMFGLAMALLAVMSFAGYVVSIRYFGARRDMMVSTAWAGALAAMLCLPMLWNVPGAFAITGHDLLVAALLGSVQVGFGFILITLGSRSVPAAQIPLLGLSETALSPLWVWLVINELPSVNTAIGGAIVLIAVCTQAFVALNAKQPVANA